MLGADRPNGAGRAVVNPGTFLFPGCGALALASADAGAGGRLGQGGFLVGAAGADGGGGLGQGGGAVGVVGHHLQGAGAGRGGAVAHGFLLAGDLVMRPRDLWAKVVKLQTYPIVYSLWSDLSRVAERDLQDGQETRLV